MRIVVNDVAASIGGALSVLKNFFEYVYEHCDDHEWIFVVSSNVIKSDKPNIKVIVNPKPKKNYLNRLFYDFFEGRRLEKEYHPDLFFSLQNIGYYGVKTRQMVFVHQSLPFQSVKKYSPFKKSELKLWMYQYVIGYFIKSSIKKANKCIVQTQWIKKAIIDATKISDDKLMVINQDIEDDPYSNDDDSFLSWDPKRFFAPISMEPYKNYDCINKAVSLLDDDLVLTSTTNYKEDDKRLNNIGYIEKNELWKNYHNSTLVFPSYIESYGLPLAEARKTGTVILASDCAFSREILEDYENAYFFDPFKPEELACLIKKVVGGEIVKKEVRHAQPDQEGGWKLLCEKIILEK